jgi:hypothetical protein
MVKADVRRDYYADLGLQTNAEAEDIKKQFRRLGECWSLFITCFAEIRKLNQPRSTQIPSR